MSVIVTGINSTIANLLNIKTQMEADIAKAVMDCGQHLKGESQNQVPVDTHNLQRSPVVEMINKTTVEVSYNTEYALKQHEELGYKHNQGKAKYLEDPLEANRDRYIDHIKTGGKSGI